jgi:selenocysteine-specific elongation factor
MIRVIGTAGHVDHGKSTLVQALTGIHPDRLKEEQEREMTIDLGFAWLTLPGGEELGIVDVPGHRDFIENMLAGVGGIDAVLFVVAADEGVMPQTREHLAILNLLQIPGGVVALTKADLVDSEWMDLIEEDLRITLLGSVLEDAPILRLSARTGQGIQELKQALSACLAERPPRPDLGRPRLPVDRVFSISGFGTVVTGTLMDGSFKAGQEVEILPAGKKGRIRGLQTHKQREETAAPGSRTAVNISGVDLDEVLRGNIVAHPGKYQPTRRMDVHFKLLPDVSQPLKHNTEVKLFLGTAEVIARVRLLGVEELAPGSEGWLQLETAEPSVAARGDHYILRRPSPSETIGGGVVIDPAPRGRHKRFSTQTITSLESLAQGTPADVVLEALTLVGIGTVKEIIVRSHLESEIALPAWLELVQTGRAVDLEKSPEVPVNSTTTSPETLVASQDYWNKLAGQARQDVTQYHKNYPLRPGMPREELKSRLKILVKNSPRIFNAAIHQLVAMGDLVESGPLLRLPGFEIRLSPAQEQSARKLLEKFAASPYSPPSVKECQVEIGEDLFDTLVGLDVLVQVSPEVAFRKGDYTGMVGEITRLIQSRGAITAAEVRDHFNTSRRYALAILEHLDSVGLTIREGDARRLKNSTTA